jgi:hypothetical protein
MINFKNTTIWSGNTYGIREQLKSFGAKWNDAEKTWTLPPADGRSNRMSIEKLWLKTDNVNVSEVASVEA